MFDVGNTKEENLRAIGSRLSAIRLSRGLTQAELAARSGVSKRSIERLENGNGNPRLEVLVAVCMELSLIGGFKNLLPDVHLSATDILSGKKLPERVRGKKRKVLKWGDEK